MVTVAVSEERKVLTAVTSLRRTPNVSRSLSTILLSIRNTLKETVLMLALKVRMASTGR